MVFQAIQVRLGKILETAGLVHREHLDAALARQVARNVRLGNLLAEMHLIDALELHAVLDVQKMLRDGRASELAAWLGGRLGALLLNCGLVSPAQLESALRTQEREGGKLGDILVRDAALSAAARDGALAFQRTVKGTAIGHRFSLGSMLLEAGLVDQATLDAALARQRSSGGYLGEALVELGAIDRSTLHGFLRRQRRIIAAAMAGVAIAAATAGQSTQAFAGSSTEVRVQLRVMKHASIRGVRTPSQIVITEADLINGFIELAEPVEVDLRTNDPAGFLLGFMLLSPMLKAAHLASSGAGTIVIDESGGRVVIGKLASGVGYHTVRLHARLQLSGSAVAGVVAWPIALYIAPG